MLFFLNLSSLPKSFQQPNENKNSVLNRISFSTFGPIELAGSLSSVYQASQDPYHIANKMKNVLHDPPEVLMMRFFYQKIDLSSITVYYKKNYAKRVNFRESLK